MFSDDKLQYVKYSRQQQYLHLKWQKEADEVKHNILKLWRCLL